ncbi:MAG: ATP-dependent DNA ligase [Phycisphaerales bacterium JB039]
MRRFTRLYLDLDATNSTSEKIELLEAYFRETPAADAAWALALLAGQRPKGSASTRALHDLAVEVAGVPEWLVAECYSAVGDMAETVALLLPEAGEARDEPLSVVMRDRVLPLAGAGEQERRRILTSAWRAFDADERFIYHKLVRGAFRVGVQKRMVARALARVAGVEPAAMAHRIAGTISPTAEAFEQVIAAESGAQDASRPYPFFLAHQLNDPPQTLGDIAEWSAEWKWDGVRAQVIRRAGQCWIWSRGEELVTEQFPEIASAARALPDGTVLDGEVLVWQGDRPAPFSALQRRLNRTAAKAAQPGLFDQDRVIFMAYDALEVGGEDVRAQPLEARRGMLEKLLASAGEGFRLSARIEAASWDELASQRAEARDRAVEGVMLKARASPYGVGRTRPGNEPGWWKWKVDPLTVDAVLIAAQPGSGRRAGLHSDMTFALWDDRDAEDRRELVVFAKAYSGLTQEEIETLDRWIRAHTVRRTGPVRHVEAKHVFELGFEDVRESKRHKCGLAVRFPRILRWRRDKQPQDADSLEALRQRLLG